MIPDWTLEFFISKAHLFHKIMNIRWQIAEKEAKGIATVLSEHRMPKGRILDLMCGNGRIAIHLAKLGYHVVGVDFSQEYIEDAKKRAIEHGVGDRTEFVLGDVRELDKFLKVGEFDGVINVWTSIGFYDEKTDEEIFRKVARISKENAILIIASTASRDYILKNFVPITITEWSDDLIMIDEHKFDAFTSRLKSRWRFYKKKGKNLIFIDEIELNLRLYSIHELYELLKRAGWQIIKAYKSIVTLEPFDPTGPINIVARKL
ncbi:MAG: class I SAM-dependent methyltransferase [Candidatus Njordarchaeia archaeon]